MKRIILAVLMVLALLAVSGCGGGGNSSPPTFVSNILSNPALDGDIEQTPTNVIITQGNLPSVFAGIDPVTLNETRAFLDFPLTGAGGVPGNAIISSATLDIFINNIQPVTGTIPMRIDLVSFPQPLIASDYDRIAQPALTSRTFPIFQSDFGKHVVVDVTLLMQEAQRRKLASFQVRILEDLGIVSPGLIEINDATAARAPLLQVIYF